MDELEREAFESKIREAVVARMAELQFGSKGPLQRSMGAIGGRVVKMRGQASQLDKQVDGARRELAKLSGIMGRGGRQAHDPKTSPEINKAISHLDRASNHLGQLVEELVDAGNALT